MSDTPAGMNLFQITASDGTNMVTSNTQTLGVGGSGVPEIDPGAIAGALTVIAGLTWKVLEGEIDAGPMPMASIAGAEREDLYDDHSG
jgi:hypothetical protein